VSAFKRKGRRVRLVKVPTEAGIWIQRSTKTRDPQRAKAMQRMVDTLGPGDRGAWDLLRLVTAKVPTKDASTPARPKMTLPALYDLWASTPITRYDGEGAPIAPSDDERMAHVRGELRDTDLSPLVDTFFSAITSGKEAVSDDTAKHYRSAVRLFVPKDAVVPISKLNERELTTWLEEMDDVEPGTVRKRGIGMGRFIGWLRGRGILRFDPMANITLPPNGDPLCHYLDTADAIRLADALSGQMRLFEYLLPGSAIEVSTALSLRVRDVIKSEQSIHAPGTKSYNRNRIVIVADFAWPAVLELTKGKVPDAKLFDRIADRWRARDEHFATVQKLVEEGHRVYAEMPGGIEHGYTMRDHRHTWAVRAVRSGWPITAVAEQLGHGDGGVLALRVYGRFQPKADERKKWEAMATARDASLAEEAKADQRAREGR
jgi:site-specific recombinase XerD